MHSIGKYTFFFSSQLDIQGLFGSFEQNNLLNIGWKNYLTNFSFRSVAWDIVVYNSFWNKASIRKMSTWYLVQRILGWVSWSLSLWTGIRYPHSINSKELCFLCCCVNRKVHLLDVLVPRCLLVVVQAHSRSTPDAAPLHHNVEKVERVINLDKEPAKARDCITVCLRYWGAAESWLSSNPSLILTLSKWCHLVIRFISCFLQALQRRSLYSLCLDKTDLYWVKFILYISGWVGKKRWLKWQ